MTAPFDNPNQLNDVMDVSDTTTRVLISTYVIPYVPSRLSHFSSDP